MAPSTEVGSAGAVVQRAFSAAGRVHRRGDFIPGELLTSWPVANRRALAGTGMIQMVVPAPPREESQTPAPSTSEPVTPAPSTSEPVTPVSLTPGAEVSGGSVARGKPFQRGAR